MRSAEERIEVVRAIVATFCHAHHVRREMSHTEYELARSWALRDVPLATVLQGIVETTGKVSRLGACERAVEENIQRWHKAAGLRSPTL
jgi:hypothetical protein